MLDYRIDTFLDLCKTLNYTKTAGNLSITQPAVSQHIHYLESFYKCKLFNYSGKVLTITSKGEALKLYARSCHYNQNKIFQQLSQDENAETLLRIGATKTIGNYMILDRITNFLENKNNNIYLDVDNTKILLKKLDDGQLDLALIEGSFDKNKYDYKVFKKEEFLGLCSKEHPFANKIISLEETLTQNLIIREEGSGTRNIFENILAENNFTLSSYKKIITISSFKVIDELVALNMGISFAYKAIADSYPNLSTFSLTCGDYFHELAAVYLKGSDISYTF